MFVRRMLLICSLATALFPVAEACADQIHFKITSLNSKPVRIDFHGVTFSHRWPAKVGDSWRIPDADEVNISLSCSEAEYLCYGAWQEDNKTVFWGNGFNREHRCASCCYNCDGGTYEITLQDPGAE